MLYKFEVEIPSGTTEVAPKETTVNLVSGIVDQVMIEFPAGCAGLVGARILQGLFQLWPLTSGEWFVTDNFTIVFPEHQVLKPGEERLRIETYNTDDTYDHTLSFRFSVVPIHVDPLKQIAEIMARRELEAAPVSFEQIADLREGIRQMYALLYSIHAADFPTLFQYLDQMRG